MAAHQRHVDSRGAGAQRRRQVADGRAGADREGRGVGAVAHRDLVVDGETEAREQVAGREAVVGAGPVAGASASRGAPVPWIFAGWGAIAVGLAAKSAGLSRSEPTTPAWVFGVCGWLGRLAL